MTKQQNEIDVIYRSGKPVAVILSIDAYTELLERLEDIEDVKMLEEMRKKPLHYKKLEDVLQERQCV